VADAGRQLGIAVANLVNLVNPARVILGGRLTDAADILLPALRQSLHARALWSSVAGSEVSVGALGDDAIAIGAATGILRAALREPARLLSPFLPSVSSAARS
jgi:predicted NBD/HSP70 family sugar kinase